MTTNNRRYNKRPTRPTKKRKLFNFIVFAVVILFLGGATFALINTMSSSQKSLENSLYPLSYSEYVDKAAKDYNLDKALIYGVIKTESNFVADAQSGVGAVGLMQVMPESFEWLQEIRGVSGTYTTEDLKTPSVNIDYGCYLLKYFYDLYGTEQCAIAAYNAGFVVGNWLEDPNYSSDGVYLDDIPYPETNNYVTKVTDNEAQYKTLYFS